MKNLNQSKSGFALITSLALASLILLFTLAGLQMSRVVIKNSENNIHFERARLNAELGIKLALSELQKHSGPDQRVSTRANVNEDINSASENKSIVGIWDTRSFDPSASMQKQSNGGPIWMISKGSDFSISKDIAEEEKEVLFPNEEGKRSIPSVKQPITDATGETIGSYSWAVDDEGMKAALKNVFTSSVNYGDTFSSIQSLSISGQPKYSDILGKRLSAQNQSDLARILSFDQVPLALEISDKDTALKNYFNRDYTAENFFLLTDVKNGGLKKDLSLAFAMPENDFNKDPNFSGDYKNRGESFSAGFVFQENTPDGKIKGPTWQLLRAHAKLGESIHSGSSFFQATGSTPTPATLDADRSGTTFYGSREYDSSAYGLPSQWAYKNIQSGKPEIDSILTFSLGSRTVEMIRPTSPAIVPIVQQYQNILSMYAVPLDAGDPTPTDNSYTHKLRLAIDYNIVLWNPYNFPLKVPAMYFFFQDQPLMVEYNYSNVYIADTNDPDPGVVSSAGTGYQSIRNILAVLDSVTSFHLYLIFDPGINGIILKPGETKVISLPGAPSDILSSDQFLATEGLNYNGGLYFDRPFTETNRLIYFNTNSRISARVRKDHLPARLYTYLAYSGAGSSADNPRYDLRYYFSKYFIPTQNQVSFAPGDYTQDWRLSDMNYAVGGNKQPIGMINFYQKPTEEPNQPVRSAQHNYRSIISEGSTQSNMGYTTVNAGDYIQVDGLSDWSNGIITTDGNNRSAWGNAIDGTGQSNVSLYEIPTKPLVSMIEFRHANLMLPSHHNNISVGFSEAHPFIPKNTTYNKINGDGFDYYAYDVAYLMNEALLDQYYFSGIAAIDSEDSSQLGTTLSNNLDLFAAGNTTKVLNTHLYPLFGKFKPPYFTASDFKNGSDASADAYQKLAATSMIRNGFNINSTSPRAWAAFIKNSLTNTYTYNEPSGTGSILYQATGDEWVVSRFALPNGDKGDLWKGTRTLSNEQIYNDQGTPESDDDTGLAVEIVKQIRKRGPFLNLADFVNHRLINNELGSRSALAQAIVDSGLNNGISEFPDVSISDYPAGVPNPENGVGSSGDAFPGYLRADDLLSPLFPAMSARSDTFTIRASGESLNPVSGESLARVTLEAVVQRLPDPVEPTSENVTSPDYYDTTNTTFGRKYKVISYRVLSR